MKRVNYCDQLGITYAYQSLLLRYISVVMVMYKLYIYIQFIHYHDHQKYEWIKWFRQSCHKRYKSIKEVEKKADVDAILIQIIKNNDCDYINKDFLTALLDYLLEHNVIVMKNMTI